MHHDEIIATGRETEGAHAVLLVEVVDVGAMLDQLLQTGLIR